MTAHIEKGLIGFVGCIITVSLQIILPSFWLSCLVLLCGLMLFGVRVWSYATGLFFALLFIQLLQYHYHHAQLPKYLLNTPVILSGTLQPINAQQGLMEIRQAGLHHLSHKPTVKLAWDPSVLSINGSAEVQLLVTLKAPSTLHNQYGHDQRKRLLSENIVALGFVQDSPSNHIRSSNQDLQGSLRQSLQAMSLKNTPMLAALLLGDRSLLTPRHWQLLQHTGTAHLFAISGLHLGLIAALIYVLVRYFFAALLANRQKQKNILNLAYLAMLLCCASYAWLSGMQVPVQRALLALCIMGFTLTLRTYWHKLRYLLFGFGALVLVFPYSIFSISFYLSMVAVSCVLLSIWLLGAVGRGWRAKLYYFIAMQVLLSVFLTPRTANYFDIFVPFAIFTNLFAIPIITFIVLPIGLIGLGLLLIGATQLALPIFTLVDYVMHALLVILSHFAYAVDLVHLPWYLYVMLFVAMLIFILPLGYWRFVPLGSVFFAGASYWLPVNDRYWQIHLFDVGHGLNALVSHHQQNLIYDLAAQYPSGYAPILSGLIPHLRAKGVQSLQYVLVSHPDNDHAGGLSVLTKYYAFQHFLSTNSQCITPNQFKMGHLRITVLWPLSPLKRAQNADSCVVNISDGSTSLLLTGDITKASEAQLIARYGQTNSLQADILLVPHHGSNTSSSSAFLQAVAPKLAILSNARNHRWNLPHDEVVVRFKTMNIELISTEHYGQISITVDRKNGRIHWTGRRIAPVI